MRRPLEVSCPLDGSGPALRRAFGGDPAGWLPEPARWHGRGRWNVRLSAGRLSRVVLCQVGPPWRVGDERWRLLSWEPAAQPGDALPVDRLLPLFTGELGVVVGDDVPPRLRLRGSYSPPAGPLGAAADAAGLHRVAVSTGRGFVAAVKARLHGLAQGAAPSPAAG